MLNLMKSKLILFVIMASPLLLLSGSWSTSGYASGVGCTSVTIPAGARYVQFRMTIDDTDDDDDYDLYVYFPTRADCSVHDCMPDRGYEWTEVCGPYNPHDYKPASVCGGPAETWRFKIEEDGWCYGGWDLDVTWVDCNVGNDCTTPIILELPDDLTYLDRNQLTTGRSNDYSGGCLGSFAGGEDIIYRLNIDRPMILDIELDPHGTAGTAFCLDNSCPPDGSCIAQSTNIGTGAHSVTGISLSAGTYYIMVDSDPAYSASIPDFNLKITSPINCSNPIVVNLPADMPYTATQQFTCGRVNNYTGTCLDGLLFDFDTGEDIIYRLNVTSAVIVDIILNTGGMLYGTTGAGILLEDECPPTGGCIDYSTNVFLGEQGIYTASLAAGTYYLMVDTDSSASRCIPDFSLTIAEASAGAICALPININLPGDLPYLDAEQTTIDRGDDYRSTCLGSYDDGEDIIYKINVYEDVRVDIELEPLSDLPHIFSVDGTGLALSTTCPAGASCLAYSTQSGSGTHGIYGQELLASVGTYYLMVDCNDVGLIFLYFDDFDFNLRITQNTTPANPPNPTSTANPCGPQTLTVSGTPPSDVVWYWQGTSCGTRTDLGSGPTYTATASGTYYIRARNSVSGNWSTGCGSVAVTVNPYPEAPTAAVSDRTAFCANDAGNISLSAVGGLGTTVRWFTGSCGGTSIGTGNPLTIPSPTVSTTYFARWENTCGNTTCASVTVSVYNIESAGVWTGYFSTDWSNPENWGQCTPPTSTSDALIPASPAYGRFPTVNTADGSCVCRNVTIEGTLNGGAGNLFVHGEWLNNATFNCGAGKITFIGTGSPAIGGSVNTTFNEVVTKNTADEIDLRRDAAGSEIDLREPGNEGLDLRDGEEIDLH